ncbi:MAG: hypothetical protein Q4D94_03530 [Bacillota bacterium]|nr:hypothetical protein [Bacillota bacterium]
MELAEYCGGLLFLAVLTPDDIREKRISVGKLAAGMMSALIYRIIEGRINAALMVSALVPGVVLLLLAAVFRESIGSGDGLAVMVLGMWTNGLWALLVVCVAIILTGVFAVIYLLGKKRETIPFVPFLLLGMEVLLFYA